MAENKDTILELLNEKNRIVQALTELNAKQLQANNHFAGVEFELLHCEREIDRHGETQQLSATRVALEQRHSKIVGAKESYNQESEKLFEALRLIDEEIAGLD